MSGKTKHDHIDGCYALTAEEHVSETWGSYIGLHRKGGMA